MSGISDLLIISNHIQVGLIYLLYQKKIVLTFKKEETITAKCPGPECDPNSLIISICFLVDIFHFQMLNLSSFHHN